VTDRYHTHHNKLWFGSRLLGPSSGLYLDAGDFPGLRGRDGTRHLRMPGRVDIVFVAGSKVVGLESKKASDLVTSQGSRRLSRQMRTLVGLVDVPGLLLRGLPLYDADLGFGSALLGTPQRPGVWDDLVRLQCLGVVLLPGPADDVDIPQWLATYRPTLADSRNVLSVFARTDSRREQSRQPGWFLKNLVGVGDVLATKLHTRFGSTAAALRASDEAWKQQGTGPKIIERRKEAML
jgi:hypothetical protein